MAKIRTLSQYFLKGHKKYQQPTFFPEMFLNSLCLSYTSFEYFRLLINFNDHIPPNRIAEFYENLNPEIKQSKHHTLRLGKHFSENEKISIRTWLGKPYNTQQLILAPSIHLKRVYNIQLGKYLNGELVAILNDKKININTLSVNDGLTTEDFNEWFNSLKPGKLVDAQILCWNHINY